MFESVAQKTSQIVQRMRPAAARALVSPKERTAFAIASPPSATRKSGALGKMASFETAVYPATLRSSMVFATVSAAPSSMQYLA